ncbi:MAG: polyprenyl synthetase family protein [Candidatus Margulisbacteria bacterium]|nr:polyprenyl synthetase family protein [Candidatus Margulisiibacteriota bacterium]
MMIDRELNKYLPKRGKLARAMRYSVFAGGKRFRPLLCVLTAKALGRSPRQVLPIAAAIEMLHTFTLIHDDLPAMDNSDLRRGKLACHKKYNEALAILAGDALNTLAFEILAKQSKNAAVIAEIGKAIVAVIEGQIMDMESEKRRINLRRLYAIHSKKTAALLAACVRASAVQLKASPKQLSALTNYARHLGLAFQIADDILDATATAKRLGKPVRADIKKGFPSVVGIVKSQRLAQREKESAIRALKMFDQKANPLRELAEFVVARES